MAWRVSTKNLNLMFGALKTALADGVILIYSGSQPASANDAVSGTLLGRVTLNAAAWTAGAATNGLEFATPAAREMTKAVAEVWQFAGIANGTAGWFRFVGNGADAGAADTTEALPRIDGRIATTGAEMNMSNLNVVTGAITTIDSFTLRWPAGVL
jgi:hypothetical protein